MIYEVIINNKSIISYRESSEDDLDKIFESRELLTSKMIYLDTCGYYYLQHQVSNNEEEEVMYININNTFLNEDYNISGSFINEREIKRKLIILIRDDKLKSIL